MFKEQKTSKIEKEIKKQINIFIEREEYEKAKEENEKLKIFSNMKNFKDFKDFDLIYIEEDNNYVFINISVFRYGIKIESIFDVIKKNKNDKGYEKIVDFFENLYKRIEIPQSLIVNKSIDFFSFPQNQQI